MHLSTNREGQIKKLKARGLHYFFLLEYNLSAVFLIPKDPSNLRSNDASLKKGNILRTADIFRYLVYNFCI